MQIILRLIIFIISITTSLSCKAADNEFQQFIPSGWKLLQSATDDDNSNTSLKFAALILEKTDPSNIKKNEDLGPDKLNLNPRRLLVLLKTSNGYKEILHNDTFIPSENDDESHCLSDPLQDIKIANGVLTVPFEFWLSCGSYDVQTESYKFKYDAQKNDFRLIGSEDSSYSRTDGDDNRTYISTNYLTGKTKTSYDNSHKISWAKIKNNTPHFLSSFSTKQLAGRYGN